MFSRNQIIQQMDSCFRDLRLIEEFDHQGKIDIEPQDIVGVDLPARPESCNASEDRDPLHGVPVMQDREDLLHKRSAPSVIRFAQIDPNHEDVVRHRFAPVHRLRAM